MKTLSTLALAGVLFAGAAEAQVQPAITLAPVASTVNVGSTITLNINVSNVVDLYSWELDLLFSPATRVSFSSQSASGPFATALFVPGTLNAGAGTLANVAAASFGATGFSGSLTIGQVSFTALNVGVVNFSVTRALMGNSLLENIFISNSNFFPGQVTVVPEPATTLLAALGLLATVGAVRRRTQG